jgi:hypothetical protein
VEEVTPQKTSLRQKQKKSAVMFFLKEFFAFVLDILKAEKKENEGKTENEGGKSGKTGKTKEEN